MKKILLVAKREFVATAGTKGFIIGLLVFPALIAVGVFLAPRILAARSPQVRGDVAVIDRTGAVIGELRSTLAPEAIEGRAAESARRAMAQVQAAAGPQATDSAVRQLTGQTPVLRVVERPAGSDITREKQWLLTATEQERHLAVVVVHPDAVARRSGQPEFGTYDMFVSRGLDQATEGVLFESLRQALVNARVRASNLDVAAVEATLRVRRPTATIVTETGEQQSLPAFRMMLPFALALLMFMGVIVGGQTLMTSTVEEKSSRVVEVLLAAVSPFELMAGKLIGQLGIGLLTTGIYLGLGLLTLFSFSMLGLLDPMLIVYLLVFFLITYLVFGALMMAIGAAVNQMAEAQSLMGPIMILMMLPYMLSPMIGRAPNSTFSIAISFIPPINTFAMMSRLASDSPPPAWQVWLTVVIGFGAACGAVWFAAKVFRIGLLMHGKAPNFATLIKWARMA
jgi:ABC-2 type transport system permease protein